MTTLADQFLQDAGAVSNAPKMSLADQFAADAKAVTVPQPTQKSGNPSVWDQLSRQAGLTVRAGINGVTGIPAMMGDALNAGINKVFHTNLAPVSASINSLENATGLPQPANGAERFSQDVASSMAGVSPSIGAGKLLASAASPTASAIGKGLQALPGMQITGAAGSGAGGALAQMAGAGPLAQVAGSMAGGLAGAVAPSVSIAGLRAAQNAPKAVISAAQPFTNPQKYVGRQLAQHLGSDAQLIAQNIRSAPEYVTGSMPTTAQVGQTPTLVATEKGLANLLPEFKTALAEREANNNAARWNVLNQVAQSPEALDAAKVARDAAASPLYDAAHANTANVGRGFINFARRPAVQQAMQVADQMARNEGVAIKWPTPEDRMIDGRALDYTARALGDMIDAAKRSGNNQQARTLTEAQTYLKNWTAQYVPGVKEAAAAYAEHSIPVNTMEAGQQISNALGTNALAANGLPQISLYPYKRALVSAIKGQPYGIEGNAAKSLQGIGQDLQRATISNSLRSPGSDTAYNIAANGWLAKQLYGEDFSGAGRLSRGFGAIGATLLGHPFVAGGILTGGDKLGGIAAKNLNQALGKLLLNPNELLPYLESSSAPKQVNQSLIKALRSNVNQGLIGSSVSPSSNR